MKANRYRYLYYTIFFLVNIATTITTPLLCMKLMFMMSERIYNKLATNYQKQLNELMPELHAAESDYNSLNTMFKKIAFLEEQWVVTECYCWKDDDSENSCISIVEFLNDMCFLEKKNIDHPDKYCRNIAHEYCDIYKHFPNDATQDSMKHQYRTMEKLVVFLKETTEPMHNLINGNHFTRNTIEPITFFIFLITSVIAVLGLIYYKISYRDVTAEYHKGIKKAPMVTNRLKNVPDSECILELTSGFNINIEKFTIERLITRLSMEDEKINKRWKHRTAFLGGALRKEASSYSFFQNDGARDLSKRILEEAGWGPVTIGHAKTL